MGKDSIIRHAKSCFFCGREDQLEAHHCLKSFNRKKADEDGLWVYLCPECHRGTDGVHGKNGHEKDVALQQAAERAWIKCYADVNDRDKSINLFRQRYGKNFL